MMETGALVCLTFSPHFPHSLLLFLVFFIIFDISQNILPVNKQRVLRNLEGRDQSGRSKHFQGRKATTWGSPGQCRLHAGTSTVWIQTY